MTIATTARSASPITGDTRSTPPRAEVIFRLLAILLAAALVARSRPAHRRIAVALEIAALSALTVAVACGGSEGMTVTPIGGGTPAGTSQLTVTATWGSVSQGIGVQLTVK